MKKNGFFTLLTGILSYPFLTYAQRPASRNASQLTDSTQQLQAITVTAQKTLLTVKEDRLIYNVADDPNKDNLSAAEMLRRVPLVTVAPDGTIRLKGSDQFRVLLNGKSTSVLARNPKDALRSFPASLIKSIEVITQPSAKYDAEGTAGIINIITRQQFAGYNGSLGGSYNSRGFAYGAGTFNAKTGRLGVAAYAGVNSFRNHGRSEARRENYIKDYESTLIQNGTAVFDGASLDGSLELSYDLDSTSSISIYNNTSIGRNTNDAPQLNLLYPDQQPVQTGHYGSFTRYSNQSYDWGIDYQKRFKQPSHTLSLSLNRNTGRNTINADNSQLNDPGPDNFLLNHNGEHNTENTLQLDYTRPVAKDQKLEAGLKGIGRTIESDYSQKPKLTPDRVVVETGHSDFFRYRQDVLAAYLTYQFKVKKKVRVQLGSRLEKTHTSGYFISSDTTIKIDYLHFIPTASIGIPLPNSQSLSIAYSRRIQRPWVSQLNPYVNDNDPNVVSHGNPDVQPESSHVLGINYRAVIRGVSLLVSPDYTYTSHAIETYVSIDSLTGIVAASTANISRREAAGLALTLSAEPLPRWNINANARAEYTSLQNNTPKQLHNTGWSSTGYMSTDYDLGKGLQAELSFSLNTSRPALQGRLPGYTSLSATLRQELFKGRAAVSLNMDQPFRKEIAWHSEIIDPSFYYSHTFYYPVRSVRLGFNWKFGQLKQSVTRKKGVQNDDLKKNEGSQP